MGWKKVKKSWKTIFPPGILSVMAFFFVNFFSGRYYGIAQGRFSSGETAVKGGKIYEKQSFLPWV
jgi:hypothetical protein